MENKWKDHMNIFIKIEIKDYEKTKEYPKELEKEIKLLKDILGAEVIGRKK